MTSFVAGLLFDNKEEIPDGLYLQLMNTLKIINDTPVATVATVPTAIIPRTPLNRPTVSRFRVGIFRYTQQSWNGYCKFFQIRSITSYFLVINQVEDATGIGADGITGLKFNEINMKKDRVKKKRYLSECEQIDLMNINNFSRFTIKSTELIPVS